ncbi:MAG: hemerythrin domain-containing protein [Cyclobacteriaceae bacterium]
MSPLKRHPSLTPLSRFHRSALFVAFVCKKGAPEVKGYPKTLSGKRDYALSFYRDRLKHHFAEEEEKLIPWVAKGNLKLAELSKEIIEEHQTLSELFKKIDSSQGWEEALFEMAAFLEKHIRKEERVFFELVQNELTEEEMLDLGKILG